MRRALGASLGATFTALAAIGAVALVQSPARADGYVEARGRGYSAGPSESYHTWTGPYVGMSVGVRDNIIDWNTTSITLNGGPLAFDSPTKQDYGSTGVQFKAFAGYNWQMQGVVLGIEGDVQAAGDSLSKTKQVIPGALDVFGTGLANTFDTVKAASDVGGSLRGRLGLLIRPNTLIYGTAGVGVQRFGFTVSCQGSSTNSSVCFDTANGKDSVVKVGWTLGAGFEVKLTDRWTWRAEYAYADYGSENLAFALPGTAQFAIPPIAIGVPANVNVTSKVDLAVQTGTVGVAYKF